MVRLVPGGVALLGYRRSWPATVAPAGRPPPDVEVDITALDALGELRRELTDRGIVFALARVEQDLLDERRAYGLTDTVGPDLVFPTLATAVAAYRRWARDHEADNPCALNPAQARPSTDSRR